MKLIDRIEDFLEEGSEVKLSSLKGKQFEKAIIDHVKKEAKTQGFFGQFLQNILGYEKEKNWFFSEVKKKKIDSFDELNKFLSDNRYFRNFQVESVNESDEDLLEESKISGIQYAVVPLGILMVSGKPIKSSKDLKGNKIMGNHKVYTNKEDAQDRAKKLSKLLLPDEGKYIAVELKDGVFTGN